jgi:hypothetical protein
VNKKKNVSCLNTNISCPTVVQCKREFDCLTAIEYISNAQNRIEIFRNLHSTAWYRKQAKKFIGWTYCKVKDVWEWMMKNVMKRMRIKRESKDNDNSNTSVSHQTLDLCELKLR